MPQTMEMYARLVLQRFIGVCRGMEEQTDTIRVIVRGGELSCNHSVRTQDNFFQAEFPTALLNLQLLRKGFFLLNKLLNVFFSTHEGLLSKSLQEVLFGSQTGDPNVVEIATRMDADGLRVSRKGFSKIRGTILGVPTKRLVAFWSLYPY